MARDWNRKLTMGTLDMDNEDVLRRVADVLNAGLLSSGPPIDEFEQRTAALHGKERGVFVNSGQSALEVALEHIRNLIDPGSRPFKVLVPTTTYAATLWAVLRVGGVPVFCDVDPGTFCIDYSNAPEDYDVALPVDLCGYPAGRPPYEVGACVIEDACEAIGNPLCTYGDIICLSFYVSHLITTGGGGMLCFDEKDSEDWMRSFISHGRVYGGDFTKYAGEWVDRFSFDKVGVSYRGDCLHAVVGLSQLKKLQGIIKARKENAAVLCNALMAKRISELQYPDQDYVNESVFQFVPLVLADGIDREKVLKGLFKRGIDSRVLFPLTTQSIFQELYGDVAGDYPVSNRINSQGFIVGCHQHLRSDDMLYIAEALEEVLNEA